MTINFLFGQTKVTSRWQSFQIIKQL